MKTYTEKREKKRVSSPFIGKQQKEKRNSKENFCKNIT